MKASAHTFVVVPAFNEGTVIRQVVEELKRRFDNVVVVNDGSSDDTLTQLQASGATVISHCVNLGQGAALQTGFTFALQKGAQFVGSFDADGQHSPDDLLAMFRRLYEGEADVVLGSRFLGSAISMPFARRIALRVAVLFARISSRSPLSDLHNGIRALNRRAASTINITQNGMAHASEIVEQLMAGDLKVVEHPVTIAYTKYSLQKGQKTVNAVNVITDLFVRRFLK